MSSATVSDEDLNNPVPDFSLEELKNKAFAARVNELRQANNWRNWFSIAREWICVAIVLGGAVSFFLHFRAAWDLHWLWNVPVSLVTIVLVGIWQHRLVMLGHEATHWVLFKNRLLNEIAANWFCFYPVWGRSYSYRVQHFAHHQFVNDPERDPVLIEMVKCGNKFFYPMRTKDFVRECLIKLPLYLPGLVRYALIRARYATLGNPPDCYKAMDELPKTMLRINVTYLGLLLGLLIFGTLSGNPAVLFGGAGGLYAFYVIVAVQVPPERFVRTKIKSDLSPKSDNLQRIAFITLLFTAIATLTHFTGKPWALYYFVIWLVPLFTSFSFLMILREDIQHAHTGREGLSHTRNFHGPLVRWALFPYHMDYHLPHHLYPYVPHYNLPKLHRLLEETEVYRRNAVEVRCLLNH